MTGVRNQQLPNEGVHNQHQYLRIQGLRDYRKFALLC